MGSRQTSRRRLPFWTSTFDVRRGRLEFTVSPIRIGVYLWLDFTPYNCPYLETQTGIVSMFRNINFLNQSQASLLRWRMLLDERTPDHIAISMIHQAT